ncbi:hypothetical protein MTR67_017591, partial [Solanum verrucosum]
DPVRYLRENGLGDTGRDVHLLRNNIDPQSLFLGGIIMELSHRDDPVVIEQNRSIATENLKSQDDEKDEHADAPHDDIFYDGKMSYKDTYDDGAELEKSNCGHEFHYQFIRRWLKRNNSCPICRRIALTPLDRNLWFSF